MINLTITVLSQLVEGFPIGTNLDHGRTVGYPAGPARIPACEIIAPGSSEILASAKAFMPL